MIITAKNKFIKHLACPIVCILFTLSVLFTIGACKDYQQASILKDRIIIDIPKF